MTKRETLKKIAEENLGQKLSIDWFEENKYFEFLFTPDIANATPELDGNLIKGLLWDYKVTLTKENAGDGTYRKKVKSVIISKLNNKSAFYKFLEIAEPNDEGKAIVASENFEQIDGLSLGNGGSWCRNASTLAAVFKLKRHHEGKGNKITSIELCGWNRDIQFSQRIKKEIVDNLRDKQCVMLGCDSLSETENKVEIDHKDGRKNDTSFNDIAAQKEEWFQPLCKAANDFKRQKCKECKNSGKRWSASNLEGFEDFPFYKGGEDYIDTCEGCYLYDPVAYRKAFKDNFRSKITNNEI